MSWATQTAPPVFAGEDERQMKLDYAALLAKHNGNASDAAYEMFPGQENYGRAWACAETWPHDEIVAKELARLIVAGEIASFLPSNAEIEKKIWDEANNTTDAKLRLDYLKLMADVRGMIQKNGQGGNVNVLVQNVIEVPTRATEEELPMLEGQWVEQQRRLVSDARANRPN